jgi:hypothetical protein
LVVTRGFESGLKGFLGSFIVFESELALTQTIKALKVRGIESNGGLTISNGILVLIEIDIGSSTVGEVDSAGRIELDGFAVFLDGTLVITLTEEGVTFVLEDFGLLLGFRSNLNGTV